MRNEYEFVAECLRGVSPRWSSDGFVNTLFHFWLHPTARINVSFAGQTSVANDAPVEVYWDIDVLDEEADRVIEEIAKLPGVTHVSGYNNYKHTFVRLNVKRER